MAKKTFSQAHKFFTAAFTATTSAFRLVANPARLAVLAPLSSLSSPFTAGPAVSPSPRKASHSTPCFSKATHAAQDEEDSVPVPVVMLLVMVVMVWYWWH